MANATAGLAGNPLIMLYAGIGDLTEPQGIRFIPLQDFPLQDLDGPAREQLRQALLEDPVISKLLDDSGSDDAAPAVSTEPSPDQRGGNSPQQPGNQPDHQRRQNSGPSRNRHAAEKEHQDEHHRKISEERQEQASQRIQKSIRHQSANGVANRRRQARQGKDTLLRNEIRHPRNPPNQGRKIVQMSASPVLQAPSLQYSRTRHFHPMLQATRMPATCNSPRRNSRPKKNGTAKNSAGFTTCWLNL